MREIRLLLYFVVGLLLGANFVLAHAETIAATQTYVGGGCNAQTSGGACSFNKTTTNTDVGSCQQYALSQANIYCGADSLSNSWVLGYSDSTSAQYSKAVKYGGYSQTLQANLSGATISYSCPAGQGYTLQGSDCVRPDCPAGQVRDGSGQCVPDCQSKAGQGVSVSWCQVPNTGATSCTGDSGGCLVRCATVKFNVRGPSGDRLAIGPYQAMGENCKFTGIQSAASDGSAIPLTDEQLNDLKNKVAPAPTPSGCAGVGRDFVRLSSGVTTCLDGDPNSNVVQSQSKKTTSSGAGTGVGDGGGADPLILGEKETDTSCQGDECKTTTKVTTDPDPGKNGTQNGGCAAGATLQDGKCVATTTQTENAGDYCAAHPNDTVCKGFKDACEGDPDRAGCKDWGTPGEDGTELGVKSLGVSALTPVVLASNNSCPASVSLPHGEVFSYEPICNWAAQWRPLVLAVSALGALLIIVGVKNG
ncbi:MAG TPA: virulence factor TspB C-terminal domain-related protein [Rhodocyclaceae bacterium]|nr:virulence factor TspB C-terminal domain-related protein [Rhodocyclaceae bacterium]